MMRTSALTLSGLELVLFAEPSLPTRKVMEARCRARDDASASVPRKMFHPTAPFAALGGAKQWLPEGLLGGWPLILYADRDAP